MTERMTNLDSELVRRAYEKRVIEEKLERKQQQIFFNKQLELYLEGKVSFEKLPPSVQQAIYYHKARTENEMDSVQPK